jgi:tetratricopeptide (TPR) repeat protein
MLGMPSDQQPPETPQDTQPISAVTTSVESDQAVEPPIQKAPRRRWPLYVLLYILAMLIVGGVAFTHGRSLSQGRQQEKVAQFLQEQFELGLQDLDAGEYEFARQRFEAIIRYDPSFPGAEEKLIEAYVAINVPTITPTARPTPTPDPSPPDQLFEHAKTALAAEDWDTVISKLLVLRSKDPTYRSVEADGMMYIALRSRGMDSIAQGLMEEGLYDLSLAERFGPLDRDASFRRTLAQQYLLANSYIGLNWAKVAELFASLCQQGATIDSCFKYAEAAWKYGDQLWDAEDPCGAREQYEGSLLAWENGTLVPTATYVADVCATATAPPPVPPTPTATPTPEAGVTEEPSVTPEPTTDTPEPAAEGETG